MIMGDKLLLFFVFYFWDFFMEFVIFGSFFFGIGEDGEFGNGEDECCNKDDMNFVYFNYLGCMFVLYVGDIFLYYL